jgi:hypothetical protein
MYVRNSTQLHGVPTDSKSTKVDSLPGNQSLNAIINSIAKTGENSIAGKE